MAKETRDHMVDVEQSVAGVKRQLQVLEDQRRKVNLIVAGVEDEVEETSQVTPDRSVQQQAYTSSTTVPVVPGVSAEEAQEE